MKRGVGFFALFAFLVTGLRFTSGPARLMKASEPKAAETTAPRERTPLQNETACTAFAYPTAAAAKDANPDAAEFGQIVKRMDRFLDYTTRVSRTSQGKLPEGIRIMIVTVPDPMRTHLSLHFDRSLEAVEEAAQDEHYTYDSSWLPWNPKPAETTSVADRNAEMLDAARREACPGIVLFRKNTSLSPPTDCTANGEIPGTADAPYLCGMLVFVVGETPTAGLNRVQWNNALDWISRHTKTPRNDTVLRVLGPTFSGSMPSYVRALEDASHQYAKTFTQILLYSGRIRGCSSWRWLQAEISRSVPPSAAAGPGRQSKEHPHPSISMPVRIADFEENDAIQSSRLYRYLVDRGHQLSEVAILSEVETAYGNVDAHHPKDPKDQKDASADGAGAQDPPPCSPGYDTGKQTTDQPVHLYYPRDISAVRSAYQEQSIFSSGSGTDTSSQPHTVLHPESNSDRRENTDSIEPFSGTGNALSEEAQLYGIVNTLTTHSIRFIILRSTNSLDYLFLTRFLHRAYPTAYIITSGSDLLFARELDSTEFRGVVALSPYPLLPRGQDWTSQLYPMPQHAHRIFGNYTMEGDYLAFRYLITDPEATSDEMHPSKYKDNDKDKEDIPDYAPPFWMGSDARRTQPMTWMGMIGREGYWPLAVLTDPLKQDAAFLSLAAAEKPSNAGVKTDPPKGQKLYIPSSWRLCCSLALLLASTHFFACRFGWRRQDLGVFVQFRPLPEYRGQALIAAGWATVVCVLLILFLTSRRIFPYLPGRDRCWVWIMGIATVLAVLAALGDMWSWTGKRGGTLRSRLPRFALFSLAMVIPVALFTYAGKLILEFWPKSESGITTAYRSVHLTSGVSPLVSLLILLAGFYWWFWQSLAGAALLGNGRPILPRNTSERVREDEQNQLALHIDEMAKPLPPFENLGFLFYLAPLLLVVVLAFALQRAGMQAFDLVLHSLENTAFNRTLHCMIAIGLYLIVLEATQLYSTWLALKRLLLALDRMPLRRTFAAMHGLSMRSLWSLSGASSRARFKILSRQMESLMHLRNELDAQRPLSPGLNHLRDAIQVVLRKGWKFILARKEGNDFAMANDQRAGEIRIEFRNCSEKILQRLLRKEWEGERCSLEVQKPPKEGEHSHEHIKLSDNMAVRAGEEFVCLTYVGYLQNLLGRMRTMVFSMGGLFAAIALSVGLYPYTPRPTISISLLFLLLAIGTLVGAVFAGLDRDSTLSHITNTEPGALGVHFWLRMVSFIGVPAMGLIVAQFPEITDFVFSWLTPTMKEMQ